MTSLSCLPNSLRIQSRNLSSESASLALAAAPLAFAGTRARALLSPVDLCVHSCVDRERCRANMSQGIVGDGVLEPLPDKFGYDDLLGGSLLRCGRSQTTHSTAEELHSDGTTVILFFGHVRNACRRPCLLGVPADLARMPAYSAYRLTFCTFPPLLHTGQRDGLHKVCAAAQGDC